MRVIALVDGEHHPPVTRWGLAAAAEMGLDPVLALLVGGVEKLGGEPSLDLGPVPVRRARDAPPAELARAIEETRPEGVLDLSDVPVLSPELRMELASVALSKGLSYLGPDFRFDPPFTEPALPVPALGVIGTGKRVAKTALAAHTARVAAAAGLRPVVVAMGRGGPAEPRWAGPEDVTVQALLAAADRGEHAASDYLEDALISGQPTVGARRSGGGLGGRPFVSTVGPAARMAAESGAGLVILEGSGASVPPVPWDAGMLVVAAGTRPRELSGHLGPVRVLLCDLAVIIIGDGPGTGPEDLSALESQVRRLRTDVRVAYADLQPVPLADVRGKDAFYATTAHPELAGRLAERIERAAGCRMVGRSWRLADRAGLEADLRAAPPFDVLLTELKAAAVDVGARRALERGAQVVFVDNRPVGVGGDGELDELIGETATLAVDRSGARRPTA